MNPLLRSAIGSVALRTAMLAVGYLAAVDENDDLPYFPAILLALLVVSWLAERESLNGWHEYKTGEEKGDG